MPLGPRLVQQKRKRQAQAAQEISCFSWISSIKSLFVQILPFAPAPVRVKERHVLPDLHCLPNAHG
jgi:hypothetical protein